MNKKCRKFEGVWIPAHIWESKLVSLIEKIFLVEINSLDNEDGCFAKNKHFAEFTGLSIGRCSQIINGLEKKKLISIDYVYSGKEIKKRTMRILDSPLFNKLKGGVLKIKDPLLDTKPPSLENAEGNSTNPNSTSNLVVEVEEKDKKENSETELPVQKGTACDDENALENQLKEDEKFLVEFTMSRKFKNGMDDTKTLLDEFFTEQGLREQNDWREYKDLRGHFMNWVNQARKRVLKEGKTKLTPGGKFAKENKHDLTTFDGFKKAYPQMFNYNEPMNQGLGFKQVTGGMVPILKGVNDQTSQKAS